MSRSIIDSSFSLAPVETMISCKIALTDLASTDAMREESKKYFGSPNLDANGIAILQEIIVSTGAKEKLESMIERLTDQALRSAESEFIDERAHPLLLELAKIATKRSA